MLKAAAAWLQQYEIGQALVPGRLAHVWGFLESPACAQYLEQGLVAVVAHYHQQQQGRAAVLGGAEVPADHQRMPAPPVYTSKDPSFWKEMLQQLMSGFIIHFLLLPSAEWNQIMQMTREICKLERKTPAEASAALSFFTIIGGSSSGKDSGPGSTECNSSSSSSTSSSAKGQGVVNGPATVPWLSLDSGRFCRVPFSDRYPEDGGLDLLKVLLELLLLLWPNQQVREIESG